MFASFFVVIVGLCYCSTESSEPYLGHPQLYGPSEAKVKDVIEFRCVLLNYPKNETVVLKLYKKDNPTKILGEYSLRGEQGSFHLYTKPQHDGNLQCLATLENSTRSIEDTVSNTHYLKVIVPVQGAQIEVLTASEELIEGETLKLRCKVTAGSYFSYEWFRNDEPIHQSHFHHSFNQTDEELWIYRTTTKDSGTYRCVANNQFNNTLFRSNTSEVTVTVKEALSEPEVSFTVVKEDSQNYHAEVTCQSTKGATPITFSLHNEEGQVIDNKTTEDRSATFRVPVVLGQHMGWVQCEAENGHWPVVSQWLPIEVVPVGGPMNMEYEYYTGENYAVVQLTFSCKVAKGTHPRYEWFLNNTLLRDSGSFYYVIRSRKSMLLLSVDRRSAGTYHCKASDSFDNSTSISSKKLYMDKEVLNRLPVLVVAVVFGCFIFQIVLVSVCCWFGVVHRRRVFGDNTLGGLEMKKNVILYEGELDVLESSEDEGIGRANSREDLDQASEASVDEWLQMIEEKKTLEDGPIEFP